MLKKQGYKIFFLLLITVVGLMACGQLDANDGNEANETDESTGNNEAVESEDAMVLKSSIQSPPEAELTQGFDVFLDKIEERSEGRIEFERYYSESLANADDHLNALSSNIADIAVFVPSYVPGQVPLANVGTNPALWEDVYVGEKAYHDLYDTVPAMQEELEAQNVKWVGQYATPSYYVISREPVNSLEDIRGLQVIATGGLGKLADRLGATVVGISVTESYEALERGTVDAVFYGLTAAATYGLEDPAKYIYQLPLGSSAGLYGMNLDVWESLPEDIQSVIREVAAEHPEDFHQIYQIEGDEASLEAFVSNGVEIIEPDPEDIEELQNIAQPIWDEWVEENEAHGGQEVFDSFRQLLEEAEQNNPFSD